MLANFAEKVAKAANDQFVAADLDRVVPKETNAVHTVSEEIDSLRSAKSVLLVVPRKPPQSVVDRANFPSVLSGVRSSHPVVRSRVCYDESPQGGLI